MPQKRQQMEEASPPASHGNSSSVERRPRFKNVVRRVMQLQQWQKTILPVLEPLIRKIVKEEVEVAVRKYSMSLKWNPGREIHPSSFESRSLQLEFLNCISIPVFTGARIEAEECSSLKVALLDSDTRQFVSAGPESSATVEMIVLEGDFDGDEVFNWTSEDFKSNIVREREGKKPLLSGDALFNLKEGIGLVGEIFFTDNSSWTRSRKFRLGARVVDNFEGLRIKEARTESFIVRDHRGELYRKHHPPSLSDEVWRLEKIGKDGAFHKRLCKERISTVKDFLSLLSLDPARLRTILAGMSTKMWEAAVDHAHTCVLDKKSYFYSPSGSVQKTGVVFNVVGQVMGLLSDGLYVPSNKLSETDKADAQNLVVSAFRHWEEVDCYENESFPVDDYSLNSPISRNSDDCDGLTLQRSRSAHAEPGTSSPDISPSIFSVEGFDCFQDYVLHGIDSMVEGFGHSLGFSGQAVDPFVCDTDSTAQAFGRDEHLQYLNRDYFLSDLNMDCSSDPRASADRSLTCVAAVPLDKGQSQRRWKILFYVLRWFFMARIVAKKTLLVRRGNCSC